MNLTEANKISVVGNSGAGKSTISKELGMILGTNVYSIDKIYWLSGWKLRDLESFNQLHAEWLKKESWIIEGVGYWHEMEQRLSESDIIVFLDVPIDLCKERAKIRIKEDQLSPNLNITEGCVYGDVRQHQLEVIEYFHNELRPKLISYLSGFNPNKVKVINSGLELKLE